MDTFIISGFITSTVLMIVASIYFMFFDKSGESISYIIITSIIFIFFTFVMLLNDNKLQHTNKCECIKESIDTTNYPIIYIT